MSLVEPDHGPCPSCGQDWSESGPCGSCGLDFTDCGGDEEHDHAPVSWSAGSTFVAAGYDRCPRCCGEAEERDRVRPV